jgi:hypothetical protein
MVGKVQGKLFTQVIVVVKAARIIARSVVIVVESMPQKIAKQLPKLVLERLISAKPHVVSIA